MAFPIMEAYIDRATRYYNDAKFTGVLKMYSDIMSEAVSHNYGQGWSVADLKRVQR